MLVTVIVSVVELPLIDIPVPADQVKVSVVLSATGSVPLGVSCVLKTCSTDVVSVTVLVMVIVSVTESPSIVIPVPATHAKVSVELSATGVLTLHVSALDKRSITLSDPNATVMPPKVSQRPFCLQVKQSNSVQCVLDAYTGLQFEKWRQALCRFASLEGAPFQLYTFSVSLCGEQMSEFSIRYSAAQRIHSEQQRLDLKFPGKQAFGVDLALRKRDKDSVHDSA